MGVDLYNLVSETTDGAHTMTGKKSVVILLKKHIRNIGHIGNHIKLHSMIYQESLMRGQQT